MSQWLGGERADGGWLASIFLLTAGLIVLLGEGTLKGLVRLVAVALIGLGLCAARLAPLALSHTAARRRV